MSIYDYDDDGFRKEIDEFQQLLTISEFSELQSLDVDGLSCFKELAILIEKTNGNILEVSTNTIDERSVNTGMLIKAGLLSAFASLLLISVVLRVRMIGFM